ncbi:MAG: hypothetical protein V4606_03945 [Patescibacteria group bacterium]
MSQTSIALAVGGFLLLIGGLFGLSYIQKQALESPEPTSTTTAATSTDPYQITRIEAKHFYRNGVHTIVGEVTMPTACDLLTADSRVAESMPEQVTFAFIVVNTTTDCEQKPTKQRFSVAAQASDQASLAATFQGVPVALNLVEAGADETPESYELFIKG